jgi:macrodomain Ter protein organizer (MatP/YcbG family)
MTTRLTFSPAEVKAILPALEMAVNKIAELATRPQYAGVDELIYGARSTYADRSFDPEMYQYLLSCRNKLKQIRPTRDTRLNVFEIAAAALAMRVVRKRKLAAEDVLHCDEVLNLEDKLEPHRKRAKRAFITSHTEGSYQELAARWGKFVAWLRYEVLVQKRRKAMSRGVLLLHKEQREKMRILALEVVVESADQRQITHLADLARYKIRKKRMGLRDLLADEDKARVFLVDFLIEKGVAWELIKPEFQPFWLRRTLLAEKFKASLVIS